MARSISLDNLPKIQRWIGKQRGEQTSIGQVIEWLETGEGDSYKANLEKVVIRDTARLGSVDNLKRLHELGYDLSSRCSYQIDGDALHVAAQNNRQSHAQALVDMGLSVTKRHYEQGPSPLDEALTNGHIRWFEKMLPLAGEVDSEMRQGFLKAAVSKKIHAKGRRHDAMKKRVVSYVLKNFGPYPQEQMDWALHECATEGWALTFKMLLEKGADPMQPAMFMQSWGAGDTTILGALFVHLHPSAWGDWADGFAMHTRALFPQMDNPESKLWGLEKIQKAIVEARPAFAQYKLDGVVARARAIGQQMDMEQKLPEVGDSRRKSSPRL